MNVFKRLIDIKTNRLFDILHNKNRYLREKIAAVGQRAKAGTTTFVAMLRPAFARCCVSRLSRKVNCA
jgi:hypothetical protein